MAPLSSLDLVDPLGFAVLTGVGGHVWRAAAEQIAARTGVAVTVHVIGERGALTDPYGDWAARSEIDTTGCVLVRPDGFVAWRARADSAAERAALGPALAAALGRSAT